MKNLYFLLVALFVFTYSNAQIVDIPDANFKNALLNHNPAIDTNNDGEIQVTEAEEVLYLVVQNDISSLEGIQSFINIEFLNCAYNQLNSLNLSQNINLIELHCSNNQLTSLNVTQNLGLNNLNCSYNELLSLDVSGNLELEWLSFFGNQITNIDVTPLILLETLSSGGNQLSQLNVTQNTNLISFNCCCNLLTNLDVTQNTNLLSLGCYNNQLTSLDISQNTILDLLICGDNLLINLDVSQNTLLKNIHCYNNQLTSLDFSQNTILERFAGSNNQLIYLNMKNGNNLNMNRMLALDNPNLTCIQVDDEDYANSLECDLPNTEGWCKDDWTSYSEECILSVGDNTQVSITIYPNPTKGIINIEANGSIIENIAIINLQGIVLKNATYKNEIDVSDLTTGIYFIQLSVEGKTVTQKFIKN